MNANELGLSLKSAHSEFLKTINQLSSNDFELAKGEKWSAGQQFDHVIKSVKALLLVFQLPRFVPKLLFGKANRPSRTYEEVVEKYHNALAKGGKAGKGFIPPAISTNQKDKLMQQYQKVVDKLCSGVTSLSEHDLDNLIVPHPLLGKMTLREILYFTLYHVQHHHEGVKKNLAEWR